MEGGLSHNFERGPPKDHPSQIWFRGEDFNVKVYNGQMPSDGKTSHGLWSGGLLKLF
jgi:hypothetical protein